MKFLRWCLLILPWIVLAGCAPEPTLDESISAKQPEETLTIEEIQKFLQVVARLQDQQPPAFTPLSESLDLSASADDLHTASLAQFRRQFDALRQGKIWFRDADLRKAVSQVGWTTVQFAGVMRSLSCAISRSQWDSRRPPERIAALTEREVQSLSRLIDRIDRIPQAKRTQDQFRQRSQAAMRLTKALARREYLELMRQIPEENVELARRFDKELAPLVDHKPISELREFSVAGE